MSKPRPTCERCPSCGKVSGYLEKQTPQRKEYRCFTCLHVWTFWRGKRPIKLTLAPLRSRRKKAKHPRQRELQS